MINAVIYRHICILNNKSYIGYTTRSMEERWKEHIGMVNLGSKLHFHNAIRKHGINNFIHQILFEGVFEQLKDIHKLEQKYIEEYNTYNKGYNSTKGGEGCVGLIVSKETKEKLRNISLKENLSEEKLLKMRNAKLGIKLSIETRKKLSISHKGKEFSDKHKNNLSKQKIKFYSDENKRKESGQYHSKKYNLINEKLNININIKNLKQYCIDNNLNYKIIHKTIKRKTCTKEGWIAILC